MSPSKAADKDVPEQDGATPRAPRPRDSDATRADLLRAAKRRFTLLGYERTTSRDIAADAHANVSLINRYFGSKEGLYEAAVQDTATTIEELSAVSTQELVNQLIDGLSRDAWPEFGNEHPLLLLLRGNPGDERTAALRKQIVGALVKTVGQQIERDTDASSAAQLRAALLLSLFIGAITLRAAAPKDPFAPASAARDALRAVSAEILDYPRTR